MALRIAARRYRNKPDRRSWSRCGPERDLPATGPTPPVLNVSTAKIAVIFMRGASISAREIARQNEFAKLCIRTELDAVVDVGGVPAFFADRTCEGMMSASKSLEATLLQNSPTLHQRRLYDKIMNAFGYACDQRDDVIASGLLRLAEAVVLRLPDVPTPDRRQYQESFVAAHERLWSLRHLNPAPEPTIEGS